MFFSEEVALIRQRIAEEGQRAMERKKEEMEEELKRKAESVKAEQKEKAELIGLRSEINAIHVSMLLLLYAKSFCECDHHFFQVIFFFMFIHFL